MYKKYKIRPVIKPKNPGIPSILLDIQVNVNSINITKNNTIILF